MTSKMSLKERLAPGFLYGAAIGAVTVILVALFYVLTILIVGFIYLFITPSEPLPPDSLLSWIFYIAFSLMYFYGLGCTIGGISGFLAWILTGLVLGGLIAAYFEFFSTSKSIMLGLIIGLSIAWIFFMVMGGFGFYWVCVGWPSIIYVFACGWMGLKIYDRMALKLT